MTPITSSAASDTDRARKRTWEPEPSTRRSTSWPPPPGMWTSSRTTSGWSSAMALTAEAPASLQQRKGGGSYPGTCGEAAALPPLAAGAGRGAVQKGHRRPVRGDGLGPRVDVLGLAHDLDRVARRGPHPGAEEPVVVDDQH